MPLSGNYIHLRGTVRYWRREVGGKKEDMTGEGGREERREGLGMKRLA